jgi:hypothetical protein
LSFSLILLHLESFLQELDNRPQNNFVFDLFKMFEKYTLTYVYRGIFIPSLTDKILALAETNMNLIGEVSKTQKRVYFVMVESLQNITRHQDISQTQDNQALFVVQNRGGKYGMASGNVIENSNIESLQQKLDKINSLDADALKAHYKDVLENTGLSEKGGAGLGLIEIARRSGSKLFYNFKTISDTLSYFYFKTKIASESEADQKSELVGIKELHQLANEKHISMVYQGQFTHDNLKSLVTMTEGSVARTEMEFRKKAANVMVELLQNICNHGGVPNGEISQGVPGILVITTEASSCSVKAGNYIAKEKVARLSAKIDKANNVAFEELDDIYQEEIMKDHEPGQKGAGLGFIDMRMKSSNKIDYSLVDFDGNFSFLSVSVTIPF